MPHLVSQHGCRQFTHHFLTQRVLSCPGIYRPTHHEIPTLYQFQHGMENGDMRRDNLSRSRIKHHRPVSIRGRRSFIRYQRVTNISLAIIGVFLRRRGQLPVNSVLEPGFFESPLPHVDGLYEIRNQKLRCSPINIKHDRLHGFNQLSPQIFLHVLRSRFQAPTSSHHRFVHQIPTFHHPIQGEGKVPDPLVKHSLCHRFFRQQIPRSPDFPKRGREFALFHLARQTVTSDRPEIYILRESLHVQRVGLSLLITA